MHSARGDIFPLAAVLGTRHVSKLTSYDPGTNNSSFASLLIFFSLPVKSRFGGIFLYHLHSRSSIFADVLDFAVGGALVIILLP